MIKIKCIPNNKKPKKEQKIEEKVFCETRADLEERIAKLENRIKIKDDEKGKKCFFDCMINGQKYKTMARYKKNDKTEALEKISEKKRELKKKISSFTEKTFWFQE